VKTESKAKVFVSHSGRDRAFADKLRRVLRLGSVFVDDRGRMTGENWERRLRANLSESDVFVFVVTPDTFESRWQLQELGAAWALDKPIIAVASDPKLLRELPVALSDKSSVTIDEIDRLPAMIASAA
jgi:hypothetical protein